MTCMHMQVMVHIAEKLQQLHAAGWTHRDLKPGNAIWLPSQNSWTLIDFGCAARIGARPPPGLYQLVHTGTVLLEPMPLVFPHACLYLPVCVPSPALSLSSDVSGKVCGDRCTSDRGRHIRQNSSILRRTGPNARAPCSLVLVRLCLFRQ